MMTRMSHDSLVQAKKTPHAGRFFHQHENYSTEKVCRSTGIVPPSKSYGPQVSGDPAPASVTEKVAAGLDPDAVLEGLKKALEDNGTLYN